MEVADPALQPYQQVFSIVDAKLERRCCICRGLPSMMDVKQVEVDYGTAKALIARGENTWSISSVQVARRLQPFI
jgi:hypothetical protein